MRKMLWMTVCVFIVAMALCTLSMVSVHRVVDRSRHLRTEAIEAMDARDEQRAEKTLVELASYLQNNQGWLEMLCSHDELHDAKLQIIDARASIEFGVIDDFYQAIYRFGETLEHLADVESVRFSNLY